MKFQQFLLLKESVQETKQMILTALSANTDSDGDIKLIDLAPFDKIMDKFNKFPELQKMLSEKPAALLALNNIKENGLKVIDLANLLSN
mgnify:CR=1 FL=1